MIKIKTNIIPSKSIYVGEKKTLNHKAICVFAATGFFLDQDTYYNELIALKPGYDYEISDDYKTILSQKQYFKWHYSPIEKPFNEIVNEFTSLFETIISEHVKNSKVILPLSGGLDSRSQAVALYHLKNKVNSYGYAFQNGHDETNYGKKIAKACDFPFQDWKVPNGYLWNKIEQLATINQCNSEFTHPRQMAFVEQYANLGDVFSLGHWGDVLFDDMNVPDNLSFENQVELILKKIIKKGGLELAEELWKSWNLDGDFKVYLHNRVEILLKEINITSSANASIRAFKSLYWAPRWTSTNLSVFEYVKPITVPYYDNRMCEFICSIPEKYLAKRQIQIEYIKNRMPRVAKITWQDHRPFNLFNYQYNKKPFNLPFRIFNKLKRTLLNKKYTQRNWELQFIGKENESKLEQYLFNNESFLKDVDKRLVQDFYKKFKTENSVKYSHSVSMLLTLSLFFKNRNDEK